MARENQEDLNILWRQGDRFARSEQNLPLSVQAKRAEFIQFLTVLAHGSKRSMKTYRSGVSPEAGLRF